jgi:hypothetical protein
MPLGLSVALLLSAQAAAAPPAASTAPAAQAPRECTTQPVLVPGSNEIVVCALKPDGYRLDPDVLAAKRMKKKGESVRPRNPHETYANHDCATVGPMGCRGQPTIDVFTAAAALAEMSERLSNGQEIGSMFQTTPAKGDYALYLEAKHEREEREADKKAKAAQAKAAAARTATDGAPATPARRPSSAGSYTTRRKGTCGSSSPPDGGMSIPTFRRRSLTRSGAPFQKVPISTPVSATNSPAGKSRASRKPILSFRRVSSAHVSDAHEHDFQESMVGPALGRRYYLVCL